MWEQRQVLVTGAGGFIGSHLTEALVKAGAKVRVFIRYNSRDGRGNLEDLEPKVLDQIEIIAGDLRDADVIERSVKGCDAVFHLGALVGIPYSYKNPREVVETNMLGTFNILTAARDQGVGKVVHTSTSEVYGSARYVPIDEAHPLQGQSPYSASKIGADMLAESFYASFELPVVTIRPFNCYGPRQSARAIIPTLITQALACKEIRLGNTEARRDFTFVMDTVEAFMKAAQTPEAVGKVINVGSGQEISIGQLAQVIIATLQSAAKIVVDEARIRPVRSEVNRLLADNRLAKETLGWEPQVSLEEGIKRTVAWIAGHMNRFQIGKYQI
jgi:dTDP-glucose 4,6-dehydratase